MTKKNIPKSDRNVIEDNHEKPSIVTYNPRGLKRKDNVVSKFSLPKKTTRSPILDKVKGHYWKIIHLDETT